MSNEDLTNFECTMNQLVKAIKNLSHEIKPEIVFVAVSAGVDSTLLLDLASHYFNVFALHVNYKLRAEESDLDQLFLEKFCSKRNIPIRIKTHDLKTEMQNKSINLQSRAREIRYTFFRDQLAKYKNSVLFIGHHSDDQTETFFINYFRNSGMAGLAGMKKKDGNIHRPFLDFSKTDLVKCAREKNLSWREDHTNSENAYLRNRFRNEIIPTIENQIPELKHAVITLMKVLRENQIQLENEIATFCEDMKIRRNIPITEFADWGEERFIELFRQLAIPMPTLKEFKKILHAKKGAKLSFPKSIVIHSIVREKDSIYFEFDENYCESSPSLKISIVKELPMVFSKKELFLDDSKIDGDLTIRKWRRGDRIHPIGVRGSKLISDVLTDAKVLHSERENQFVLCDASKILSCIGHCIDRRAIATVHTKVIRLIEINLSSRD
ncbi:MAG: tRNA lysidine(34) synthetase TilS [Bacteroidetes bacterium]|nr:tRNA lysidine(34) synthetase TilS [Bacteroidota bacterium]